MRVGGREEEWGGRKEGERRAGSRGEGRRQRGVEWGLKRRGRLFQTLLFHFHSPVSCQLFPSALWFHPGVLGRDRKSRGQEKEKLSPSLFQGP